MTTLAQSVGQLADAKSHGLVGGLLSGQLGASSFEVGYALDARSKCHELYCLCSQTQIASGALRIGRRPPTIHGNSARVSWYHPKCIFQSFVRMNRRSTTIRSVNDLNGIEAISEADQQAIARLVQDWHIKKETSNMDYKAKARGARSAESSTPMVASRKRTLCNDSASSGNDTQRDKLKRIIFAHVMPSIQSEEHAARVINKPPKRSRSSSSSMPSSPAMPRNSESERDSESELDFDPSWFDFDDEDLKSPIINRDDVMLESEKNDNGRSRHRPSLLNQYEQLIHNSRAKQSGALHTPIPVRVVPASNGPSYDSSECYASAQEFWFSARWTTKGAFGFVGV